MKQLYLFFIIFLNLSVFAQRNFLNPIYFGTDVFMSGNKQKNDLKVSFSNQRFDSNNHDSYKVAYSFSDKYLAKASYKVKKYEQNGTYEYDWTNGYNRYQDLFNINDVEFSVGWHKYYERTKINETKRKLYDARQRWKNEVKTIKGKSDLENIAYNEKRPSALIFETNIGYGFANLTGYDDYRISTLYYYSSNLVRDKILKVQVERINLDASIYYLTRGAFVFSYNLRFSAVNFKNIREFDALNLGITDLQDYLYTIDFIKANDPFFMFESNFKMNIHVKYIDFYLKLNDVIGKANNNLWDNDYQDRYSYLVYNFSAVAGITVNLHSFQNLINRSQ